MERVRRALRGLPLRVRLVVAVVLLGALGLAASGFAATAQLRGYLLNRLDEQVVAAAQDVQRHPGRNPDGGGPDGGGPSSYLVEYLGADGTVLGVAAAPVNNDDRPKLPTLTPKAVLARDGQPFSVAGGEGTAWRVVAVPILVRTTTGVAVPTAVVAASQADVDRTTERLIRLELLVGLAVLVLLGVVGYVIVRRSLRPLNEVEATAAAIADGDLTRRVPELDPRTEVGQLSGSLNAMLGQIEGAFRERQQSEAAARASEERMRRFIGDASHELRTPLTSIRGFAELHRQGAVGDGEELTRVIRRIEDEAARMGVLVDDLLLLARLDQQRPLERRPVDLKQIGRDAAGDLHAIAPERDVAFEDLGGEPLVSGDEARLRQVVANLIANAVTHTPGDALIRVRAGVVDADAVLEVADTGPGLATDQADRVFERFYRADASRTRTSGGSGLGLSIVAALVAAHGGLVELDTAPGAGATFRIRLPLAAIEVGHGRGEEASD
ncbi:MAG: two-component system, OmpR family, sensor kinase [Frankiaceae bacterium]|jgi:two-component system OmpR family sensor kinase|nr:two-component system, OmpR family, sensor kinase [Frankiaceae bacterium]MDX6225583.1 two-component system, OmpR family, sensor kinase [Frankiales bacterium]